MSKYQLRDLQRRCSTHRAETGKIWRISYHSHSIIPSGAALEFSLMAQLLCRHRARPTPNAHAELQHGPVLLFARSS